MGRQRLGNMLSAFLPLFGLVHYVFAGQNFDCRDSEIRKNAERCRVRSAQFWSGEDLPGDWSRPCPITVSIQDHSGGGATHFLFDRGEVSGWHMQVEGRREAILEDVLPHEVDHMVRASLVRRPIPRWLDEGCAILMESCESHAAHRQRLRVHLSRKVSVSFLDEMDYPTTSQGIDQLYTVGFSMIEYLLTLGTPHELLTFQQDPRRPGEKLQEYYGLRATDFVNEWHTWAVERSRVEPHCHEVGCVIKGSLRTQPLSGSQLPELRIFTSAWCAPCQQFWSDLQSDTGFREQLVSRYRIVRIDADKQPMLTRSFGVRSLPTFRTAQITLSGYKGTDWLLRRLGIDSIGESTAPAPDRVAPGDRKTIDQQGVPNVSGPKESSGASPREATSRAQTGIEIAGRWLPSIISVLGTTGTLATGGISGALAGLAVTMIRRRRRRRQKSADNSNTSQEIDTRSTLPEPEGGPAQPTPFPRKLDEARELLAIRQSEGRVAILDALRGMFLDDELDKLTQSGDGGSDAFVRNLRTRINARVDEALPCALA